MLQSNRLIPSYINTMMIGVFLAVLCYYAFETAPVPSSVIHMTILKGALTSHSTISATH